MSGADLTEGRAAGMMELSQGEVVGLVRELSESAVEVNRPVLGGHPCTATETLPNGRTT
jgi:hypothetical protein